MTIMEESRGTLHLIPELFSLKNCGGVSVGLRVREVRSCATFALTVFNPTLRVARRPNSNFAILHTMVSQFIRSL
jgi:hypothetical protein